MIRAQADGANQGLPVVWLHGWGLSSAIWQAVPAFTPGTMQALDLPGHGGRAWDDALGDDCGRWAEELLSRAPPEAVWVGWSLGGLLALEAARRAPGRVARLILLAAPLRFLAGGDPPCGMAPSTLDRFMADLEQDPSLGLQRFFALQTLGADHAREMRVRLMRAAAKSPPAQQAALRAGLRILRQMDLTRAVAGLDLPVQVLLGGQDRIVPPCAARVYREALPQAEVHIQAGAGHAPFLHAPDLLAHWLEPR